MEFLKKFSDDLSNTTVGPPTFFQNDDQEAGGLTFRASPSPFESSPEEQGEENPPIGAPPPFGVPQQRRNPTTLLDTKNRAVCDCTRHLIKAFSLTATPQPSDGPGALKPFEPATGCQYRAWKEGDDYCIRWCSYPGASGHGMCASPHFNILLHKEKFDEQTKCHGDDALPGLQCGLRKLTAADANGNWIRDIKKSQIFLDIFNHNCV
eukprot:GHVP01002733.1.p1 GENE.GHVP01002733.1~~GHVP01002733.1.p1  ORF type:complete len:219 (+),score=24.69 GHVP01002733.1:34-657(+)